MKILIDKAFQKDTAKVNDKKILHTLADSIEQIQKAGKLTDIQNCKKLKGSKNAYRIRIRDYRAGFVYENRTVIFVRFLHRSKVYDYFPD
jgi:mRNA interferase RelE/StbE